jgi:AmmeMemoRadiSam system protein B/AmmeMemoRadiSam system protein A
MATVHASPYSGRWYPDRRADLERLLDELFQYSERRTGPNLLPAPWGFVVPHAGLQYSGSVAAAAYRHVRAQQPRRALIVGFAHRGGLPGIAIPDIDAYQTPLGKMRVDRSTALRLAGAPPFRLVAEDRICDHSVEIQLPLLQWAAPGTLVVPLLVGHLDAASRDTAARRLAEECGPQCVFLISSDLTHYGRAFGYQPFPVDSALPARLARLDRQVMEAAASLDAQLFREVVEQGRATVCGVAPIDLWLRTLSLVGGDEIFQETLDYQTSGDVTGDYHHTVSYGALGYFPAPSFCLDREAQDLLGESARETLRQLRARHEPAAVPPRAMPPALWRKSGVFVGLRQANRLLGCVGHPGGLKRLADQVPQMTLAAALYDPRFPSVLGVAGAIDIEISVLSPLKPVPDARAFCVGRHGATIECGGRHALLLPQVASERNWDTEQFLSALATKAGLGTESYQATGARLRIFRAQVFSANVAQASATTA